jgi:hypothetical protein
MTSRSAGREHSKVRQLLNKEMKKINDIVEHLIPLAVNKLLNHFICSRKIVPNYKTGLVK